MEGGALRRLDLGSTGCQAVPFGRWPNACKANMRRVQNLFAASCSQLKADSLLPRELRKATRLMCGSL